MDESLSPTTTSDLADGESQPLEAYLRSIKDLLDQMQRDQSDIEWLRSKSQRMQSDTDRLLSASRTILAELKSTD